MKNYKEIIEKLKDDERFIEVVQETLNEQPGETNSDINWQGYY